MCYYMHCLWIIYEASKSQEKNNEKIQINEKIYLYKTTIINVQRLEACTSVSVSPFFAITPLMVFFWKTYQIISWISWKLYFLVDLFQPIQTHPNFSNMFNKSFYYNFAWFQMKLGKNGLAVFKKFCFSLNTLLVAALVQTIRTLSYRTCIAYIYKNNLCQLCF